MEDEMKQKKASSTLFTFRATTEDRELMRQAAELVQGTAVDGIREALKLFVQHRGEGPDSHRGLQSLVKAAVLDALRDRDARRAASRRPPRPRPPVEGGHG